MPKEIKGELNKHKMTGLQAKLEGYCTARSTKQEKAFWNTVREGTEVY